jgi:hypothetical protein
MFKNKVVVISGSNGLLGESLKKYFFSKDAKVVGIDLVKKDNMTIKCDITNEISVKKTFKYIEKKYSEKIIKNRMCTLKEAVDYISFFSSDKSSYSNGSSVIIDGGATSIL